jgi:hypothetical protein
MDDFSDEQIKQWQEAVALRRRELFGHTLKPKGLPQLHHRILDITDIFELEPKGHALTMEHKRSFNKAWKGEE